MTWWWWVICWILIGAAEKNLIRKHDNHFRNSLAPPLKFLNFRWRHRSVARETLDNGGSPSLGDHPCQVSSLQVYSFSRYSLSATSKGHVTSAGGGAKKFRFLKTTCLAHCPRKISAHSDAVEFWRFSRPPSKIKGPGAWTGLMTSLLDLGEWTELLPNRQAYLVPSFRQIW